MSCDRELGVNALRILALDAVEQAQSGHPGMVLGMADIAEVLFRRYLRHNPADPAWPDRDRFVLSNGHGSMLIYGLLHLTGYPLPMSELKAFRQLGSQTPGHPEFGHTPGVETTTGPLGQGLATAVGMALAEKILAARFNRPDHSIVDHRTYVFVGDGCLMEGVSQEAISLAGVQKLGKLVVLWDDNGVSIDGALGDWFAEDVPQRFAAAGWNTLPCVDGHDPQQIDAALQQAQSDNGRPWFIPCRTRIGLGLDKLEGQAAAHSDPVGADAIAAARQKWQWPNPPFEVPDAVYEFWNNAERGEQQQGEWRQALDAYRRDFPQEAEEMERRWRGELPDLDDAFAALFAQCDGHSAATRKSLTMTLNATGPLLPELVGSSADLAGSNGVLWQHSKPITADAADGNHLHAGVREFGMSAALNGMALHGGFRPFGGTFLTFSDYARPAVRLAALMHQPVIFVYSHDSLALGEDGPTHQPVEHLASLRAMPNLNVWRPASALETAVAWREALTETEAPSALLLTRQSLPALPSADPAAIAAGGYELVPCAEPDIALLASGSEVALCYEALPLLQREGLAVRLVSMPCLERLVADEKLCGKLLDGAKSQLAVEAASGSDMWRLIDRDRGDVMALSQFGVSAPGGEAMAHFGFTAEKVAEKALALHHAKSRARS